MNLNFAINSIAQDKINELLSYISLLQHSFSSIIASKYKMGITTEVPTTTIMVTSIIDVSLFKLLIGFLSADVPSLWYKLFTFHLISSDKVIVKAG